MNSVNIIGRPELCVDVAWKSGAQRHTQVHR